jgi:zinc transport system permease protein
MTTAVLADFFDPVILERLAQRIGPDWHNYHLASLLSILFITAVCGMVGTLVVGNRMAFFSDAMAHCAFAGISLGMIIAFAMGFHTHSDEINWLVPLLMALFGALIGVGIAFVRENTGLASDTVIGVFFAGALGFGAIILQIFKDKTQNSRFDPEAFLFGGPMYVMPFDLIVLALVLVATVGILFWRYNQFVLASFNPSLARSRGIWVQLNNYVFIVLLALIVNFSITAVGVLLINALLIVPAATASNLSTNMRQWFRLTFVLSVLTGLGGLYLNLSIRFPVGSGDIGVSGAIICLSVILFALSMLMPAMRRRFAHLG